MIVDEQNMDKPLVLIVDDDPITQLLHRQALDRSDISVIVADNGSNALASFAECKPDMILLDVQMPDMDGFEVCRAIRSLGSGRDVPILMITGKDDISSIQQAFQAGATDFVTKPVKPLILTERIRYMLRASSAFQQLRKAKEAALKAQKIARLGSWEFNPGNGHFLLSDQVRQICGIGATSGSVGWEVLVSCVHAADQKGLRDALQDALRFGRAQLMDHRVILPDGTERILSHQIEVEINEGGEVLRLYGTVQDITERKRGELLEIDRNQILQSIVQNQPLPLVMNHLVMVLERQCPSALGCVCLVQEEQLKVIAAPGLSESFCQALDSIKIGPESGCCGAAAYLGQPVTASDVSRVSFWNNCRDAAAAESIQASLSVPMLSGKGRVLGTVSLFYRQATHKTLVADMSIAGRMAQLAAVAIEQSHLSELLVHQAKHDSLTGLLNRSALGQTMGHRLNGRRKGHSKTALLLIDLDRFKRINDSLGHQIGDLLLVQVGERLKDCIRKSDALGRIGGDEFLMVLSPVSVASDAKMAAERILKSLTEPFYVHGHQLYIGASIGISISPDDGTDPVLLQKNADIAMYVAKNDGGNGYRFFSPEMNASFMERLQIENDLRKAVERHEFELHYQPQYDLQSGKITALEALIRWNHPEAGRLPPDRFIHVAEETSLIIPIGAWVIREACRQVAQWISQGYSPVRVAVNVSALQFTQTDFADIVEDALKSNRLDSSLLEIEITETVIMKDKEEVRKNLGRLKTLGVMTTIDDFGTGYSSISYLRQMPLDCIKIDRSFIKELVGQEATSLRTRSLVKAFVSLAKNLNLKLVAEGIENIDQQSFVSSLGCESGQGFLFSVPLPASEIQSFLHENEVHIHTGALSDEAGRMLSP